MTSLTRIVPVMVVVTICACETISQDSEVSGDSLWGEAGARAYPEAAQRMANESPAGVPIEPKDKQVLRRYFGNLVDRVSIHWNSQPLDEIVSSQYGVSFTSAQTNAQTYGYDIYVRGPRFSWGDRRRLEILIHELTHSQQFERNQNSLSEFGYQYFREYYRAGQIYRDNIFEQEAYRKAENLTEQGLQEFLRLP